MEDFDQAKQHLKREIENIVLDQKQKSGICRPYPVIRVEVPLRGVDPLQWLRQQKFPEKMYWSDRDSQTEMAGAGLADALFSNSVKDYSILFNQIDRRLSHAHPHIRYYGGFRFDSGRKADSRWRRFGNWYFFLPRFEIFKKNAQTSLSCHVVVSKNRKKEQEWEWIRKQMNQLRFREGKMPAGLPRVLGREDRPSRSQWIENVNAVRAAIDKQEIQKGVLARQSVFKLDKNLRADELMQLLKGQEPNVYHFLFQPAPDVAFMGATPEQLYYKTGRELSSEALAGTRPRRDNVSADQVIAGQLLSNRKELQEHRWVSRMVQHTLNGLCMSVEEISRETLMKLHYVQHIYSRYKGILKENMGNAAIIERLHPTPAVCGMPRRETLQMIDRLEPFDRGWYAGPVGWVSASETKFAVAIRSALITGDEVSMYAGAGIVGDSDPAKEWQELENKIMNYTKLFFNR